MRSLLRYRLRFLRLYPPGWRSLAARRVREHPFCAFCLARARIGAPLQVHHIVPVHVAPQMALDPKNLVVLCPPCHLYEAHVGDFQHGYDIHVEVRAVANALALEQARRDHGVPA